MNAAKVRNEKPCDCRVFKSLLYVLMVKSIVIYFGTKMRFFCGRGLLRSALPGTATIVRLEKAATALRASQTLPMMEFY